MNLLGGVCVCVCLYIYRERGKSECEKLGVGLGELVGQQKRGERRVSFGREEKTSSKSKLWYACAS